MSVSDILNSVKFVVEPDGQQSAVVVDMDVWKQIVTLLEDAEELKKAQVTIDPISILRGDLPPRVFGLVAEWALVHQDELREDWKLVQNETPPNKIDPLE